MFRREVLIAIPAVLATRTASPLRYLLPRRVRTASRNRALRPRLATGNKTTW